MPLRPKNHGDDSLRLYDGKLQAHSTLILIVLLTWAIWAVYGQVRDHEFVTYDDYEYVVQNPFVRSGITLQNLGAAFTSAYASNWHPLTWISHMVDAELFGINPSGHNMTNLVLHIVCTILLFVFLLQTTGARWKSFLVAALFALHPLHVESVAWVAERKDVLSSCFWMLTLLAYRRYARCPRAHTYLLTLALFTLGLMAKPMLVTLPFVMLLLDYWPLHRLNIPGPNRSVIVEKIPFFLLSVLCSALTFMVQSRWGAVLDTIPIETRIFNGLYSCMVYVLKTFWPHPLAFYYPHPLDSIPRLYIWASSAFLCVITFLAVRYFRRLPYLTVGWFWFLGTLVPVIGLVQVGGHGMADRYTYIPLIGLFVILAWGTEQILRKWAGLHHALIALWAVFLLSLSVLSYGQTGFWKDSLTLYEHAISVTSGNIVAHNNLGSVLARKGDLIGAERHFRRVLELDPRHASAHNNLGAVLVKQGRIEEALQHYEMALRIRPDFREVRMNLRAIQKESSPPGQKPGGR